MTEYTANVSLRTHATFTPMRAPVQGVQVVATGKRGDIAYPLGEQIASTVEVHGLHFAASYYAKRGVPLGEFMLLGRGAGVL
jgi:hypothetical protein